MAEIGAQFDDPNTLDDSNKQQVVISGIGQDRDDKQPIAPDQFDEKFRTTKWEIWAYYTCVLTQP